MTAQPFAEIQAGFDALVCRVFPAARRGAFAGLTAWGVPRPARAPRYEGGTMPGDRIILGIAERKSGVTTYVWYPAPGHGLAERQAELEAAGFKVMVGCLVFSKKQPYPFAALEALLCGIRAKEDAYA